MKRSLYLTVALAIFVLSSGCSVRKFAVKKIGDGET